MIRKFKKILSNRLLQHIAFWMGAFYVLIRNFATSSVILPVDIIFTSIFMLFIWVAVYANLLLLIPRLFQREKYLLYAVALLVMLVLVAECYILGFDSLVDWLFPGYYLISYFDFWDTLKIFIILVGLTSLFHFSKSWFWYREAEIQLASNEKARIAAELEALKNQINPHFLFNSLNSIYSLVLKKSDAAAPALIQLSDILRYVIYETVDFVPLEKELDFIRNYVEMQRLRINKRDMLTLEITGATKSRKIAPLLLIPIIENCFKHGIKGDTEKSYVHIAIAMQEDQLCLHSDNTLPQAEDNPNVSAGTGLQNLRKRLEMVYPGNYNLKIDRSDTTFSVNLTLDL